MSRTFEHQGTQVTVRKADDGLWEVQVPDGRLHRSRFLDLALEAALPNLVSTERDKLVMSLMTESG